MSAAASSPPSPAPEGGAPAPAGRRRRGLRALAALALLLLAGLLAADGYAAWRIRYPPWWRLDDPRDAEGLVAPDDWAKRWWGVMHPRELPFPAEAIEAKGAGGKTLRGWYWPQPVGVGARAAGLAYVLSDGAPRTTIPPGGPPPGLAPATTVLLVHGGGADRRSMLKYVRFLHEGGCAVAALDLGEHGASDRDGSGLTFGVRESEDVIGMIDALERRGSAWIALLGDSVGGASVILAGARDRRARAVIAQNAYADFEEFATDVVAREGAPRLMGALVAATVEATWPVRRGNVVPADEVGKIAPRPVLVLQGADDSLCLPKHAERLYAAAKEPRELWIVPGARHATLWNTDPAGFEARVLAFLARARAAP